MVTWRDYLPDNIRSVVPDEKRNAAVTNVGDESQSKQIGKLKAETETNTNDSDLIKEYRNLKAVADEGNVKATESFCYELINGKFKKMFNNKQNWIEARPYLLFAADNNSIFACVALGLAYSCGYFGEESLEQAVKYYKIAALKNDASAQFRLGSIIATQIERGVCLKEDENNTWHWLCCAHLNGYEEATEFINRMIDKSEDPERWANAINYEIDQIKKYGIDPKNRK